MLFKNKSNAVPILALILSAVGLVFIYSASSYSATLTYGDSFFYVKKQAVALAVGVFALLGGKFIPYSWLIKGKWIVLALSIVLLILVYIPGLGVESYGAVRWINLGFTTFQPSEFSKFGFIIFLASYFYEKPPVCLKNILLPLSSALIICGLVIIEPNMSITVVIGASFLVLLFIAGVPKKFFLTLCILVPIAGVILLLAEPYRLSRLSAFLNPWENPKGEGYQLIQSFYAISSGGLFGVGLFQSRQKYLFLPFAESDFIFSIIAEETGLFGCLFIIAVFALLLFCGYKTAITTQNPYRFYLVSGLTSVIAGQTVVNMAVVTGCIPPTGVPLPFVSFGGSSLVCFLFVAGLISNQNTLPKNFLRHKNVLNTVEKGGQL